MQKRFILLFAVVAMILTGSLAADANDAVCAGNDAACRDFSALAATDQYEKIIDLVEPDKTYTAESREYIGQAYLMVAGRESNSLEQEEQYCRKALEYGASSAYMGLYFIHAGSDPEKALGFLKQYVATGPRDSVPYVILGEVELEKRNYEVARNYLVEARKLARGRSSNLDWLMFQANYLLGDYAAASALLDSAITQGRPVTELKVLMADPRFLGLENRPEFRKYEPLIKGTSAMAAN